MQLWGLWWTLGWCPALILLGLLNRTSSSLQLVLEVRPGALNYSASASPLVVTDWAPDMTTSNIWKGHHSLQIEFAG